MRIRLDSERKLWEYERDVNETKNDNKKLNEVFKDSISDYINKFAAREQAAGR
jgi:hypothetical protein